MEAVGEVEEAIDLIRHYCDEMERSDGYRQEMPGASAAEKCSVVLRPYGVFAVIAPFNFPVALAVGMMSAALVAGNSVVFKPSDAAGLTGRLVVEALVAGGLPDGVLNVVQGTGPEAGAPLVEHEDVDLVSFTGSAATGRWINETAGRRLAKVCLELGGKNALVVCDDADLDNAVRWAIASAFSNAGQRCASASRVVVFDSVYDAVRERLVEETRGLPAEPVISEASLERMLAAVGQAVSDGATVLAGGERLERAGWHLAPTVLEGVAPEADLSCTELFGPVTILYRVRDLDEAIALVNDSPYGLTSSIHTASVHRAMRFAEKVQAGVVVVNGGTHGSEPHMGFGGVKQSGTGWREAGVEALDVYSDWKTVNLIADPAQT